MKLKYPIRILMKKKKKYIDRDAKIKAIQDAITSNHNLLWHTTIDAIFNKVETDSFFDREEYISNTSSNINFDFSNNKDVPEYNAKIVDMIVNEKQHKIFLNWFRVYIEMYNETILCICKKADKSIIYMKDKMIEISKHNKDIFSLKSNIKDLNKEKQQVNKKYNNSKNERSRISLEYQINEIDIKIKTLLGICKFLNTKIDDLKVIIKNTGKRVNSIINFYNLRDNYLSKIKAKLIANSGKYKERIYVHVIDSAIKLACTGYKSCMTNYLKGNIDRFRIKLWRQNRNNKIIEIEKETIKSSNMFKKILGNLKLYYDGNPYKLDNKSTIKIIYYKDIDKYSVFVSEKVVEKNTENKDFICIDPNIRPFIAGRTNNKIIKIGGNVSKIIKGYFMRIDKINNGDKYSDTIKKKKVKRYTRKIRNLIDEIHWKTISYIICNYKDVLIGNLSMKSATSNKNSVLTDMTKRVGLAMRFSEFRRRLEYKCLINGINYKMIDEWGSSKSCSFCGNYNQELKGEKVYKCIKCGRTQDRDVNSTTTLTLLNIM